MSTPAAGHHRPTSCRYFGSKNQLFQQIINLIPLHERYVEPFAGSAAVARHLRPARHRILIERSPAQCEWLREQGLRVSCANAIAWIISQVHRFGPETVLYADPPYPRGDRLDPRPRYAYELTDQDHHQLAKALRSARCVVMVSGYNRGLYAELFADWQRFDFRVILRSGKTAIESVWVNQAWNGTRLHDYRYFGLNKQIRQDVRRKVSRTLTKLRRMDWHHRQAVLDAIRCEYGDGADLVAQAQAPALQHAVDRRQVHLPQLAPRFASAAAGAYAFPQCRSPRTQGHSLAR